MSLSGSPRVVSVIPSGVKRSSSSIFLNGRPASSSLCTMTARSDIEVVALYAHTVPGWKRIGSLDRKVMTVSRLPSLSIGMPKGIREFIPLV